MADLPGDINLEDWVQTSESPLNSDDSYSSATGGFGDLTIEANGDNNNDDSNGVGGVDEEEEGEEDCNGDEEGGGRFQLEKLRKEGEESAAATVSMGAGGRGGGEGAGRGGGGGGGLKNEESERRVTDEILKRLARKFDDINTTTKSRHRFTVLTELSQDEILNEPEIIRTTDTCVTWPCDVIGDVWYKTKVYFGRKCKLPCCQEYALPHEMARHRRFLISKRFYLGETCVTPQETDAILRWADLVRSQEWKEGQWNERGVLPMRDTKVFVTGRVSWSVMEEHLATLAYSKKRRFVFLATRICIETLAKNRGLYSYSHQYWGFARICTDLLKYRYAPVQDGILKALQLYLRTLKIFHSCFTTKCSEWASAGLFPVLMDILDRLGDEGLQGEDAGLRPVVVNILVLMATHVSYVNLAVNMGLLNPLITMATAQSLLLRRRVYGCLEIFAKNSLTQPAMIKSGLLPLVVRQLSLHDRPMTLSCLMTLSTVCQESRTLEAILAVDKKLVVKAVVRLLLEEDEQAKVEMSKSKLIDVQVQSWCTITRQSLLLTSRLCVDKSACEMMVKRGLLPRLRDLWLDSESVTERCLILEVLAVCSRHPKPADKLCRENFLPILTDTFHDHVYHEPILQITFNLGKKQLEGMLDCGLLPEVMTAFGDKVIHRKYFNLVLNICAAFASFDKVQRLVLSNQARAYMLILDIAFTTNDYATLKSCVSILARLDSHRVPTHILRPNGLLLVAYIDKLLKTGHDDLVLHGLLQLQDLIRVDFLHASFREHHTQKVVEILCESPYPPPVQMIARQVVSELSGQRSRRSSFSYDSTGSSDDRGVGGSAGGGVGGGARSRHDSFRKSLTSAVDEDEDSSIVEEAEDDDDEEHDEDDGDVNVSAVRVNIIGATDNEEADDDSGGDDIINDNGGGGGDGNNNNDANNNGDDDDDDGGFEIINTEQEDLVV